MIDYGNARVAAMRSRLLDRTALARLAEAGSPATLLGSLEREEDWAPVLRMVSALAAEPAAVVDAAIERHRSARLGALPRFYEPPFRALVTALVVPLDVERIVALVRRRRAGAGPDELGATIVGGALLGPADLGRLARAATLGDLGTILLALGLVDRDAVRTLRAAADPSAPPERWESALVGAIDRTRTTWAAGRGADATAVRWVLADERRARDAAAASLADGDSAGAAMLDRGAALARLDGLARIARRDPLGIGPVAGYVAALEAGAIRLRAILAGLVGGWSRESVGSYLATGVGGGG
jgi:vacuolar-type H+-ATPase subunit C/Vma6